MNRHFSDWIDAYLDFTSHTESPKRMHFWVAAAVIAGALRRRVWIEQAFFRWYPNLYVILVAPPGIVSKSTTAGIGMRLLRAVPGIKFGPDVVTWQALITALGEAQEGFEWKGEIKMQAALTFESSEFGNLLDPRDRGMVDLLVSLWDGKEVPFSKVTKTSGTDCIENPWINLVACTTPAWIAGNFPDYMIGGGFTSRCVFVYADCKEKLVAYPGLQVAGTHPELEQKLIDDLRHIADKLVGPMTLTQEAVEWGTNWYREHHNNKPLNLDDERFGGYLARKQTHVHKLAMILSAAQSDSRIITRDHLETAAHMTTDLEPSMAKVFSKMGKTDEAQNVERLLAYIHRLGSADYADVFRYAHSLFSSATKCEDILLGCVKAGHIRLERSGATVLIHSNKKSD